jgi:hypothetical protein
VVPALKPVSSSHRVAAPPVSETLKVGFWYVSFTDAVAVQEEDDPGDWPPGSRPIRSHAAVAFVSPVSNSCEFGGLIVSTNAAVPIVPTVSVA